MTTSRRVAVVGSGVSGLAAASSLVEAGHRVVVYEADDWVGGHAHTQYVDGIGVDTGFMVCNRVTYPNMLAWFDKHDVRMEPTDMSFGVSINDGQLQWSSNPSGLFAQKSNAVSPSFLMMLRRLVAFEAEVNAYVSRFDNEADTDELRTAYKQTLGEWCRERGYTGLFLDAYLLPVCACVWSCPTDTAASFPALPILTFMRNHHLISATSSRPVWMTPTGRSQEYVRKVTAAFAQDIRTQTRVTSVTSFHDDAGQQCVRVRDERGGNEVYDAVIMAGHAPDILEALGDDVTEQEQRVLGAFKYESNDVYLHRDESLMPPNRAAWAAWNFLGDAEGRLACTYWLNTLQNLGDTGAPILATLNPPTPPSAEKTVSVWRTSHPIPDVGAACAILELDTIQGKRGIYFAGAWQRYGFHEDGCLSGIAAAHKLMQTPDFALLPNPPKLVLSTVETIARTYVMKFLQSFIAQGRLEIREDGGNVYVAGDNRVDAVPCAFIDVHRGDFYTRIASRADLGLAEAYMAGAFDSKDMVRFFEVIIINRDRMRALNSNKMVSMMLGSLGTLTSLYKHVFQRRNTVGNAQENIRRHYDLGNDLYKLFLDETMTYSCGIFRNPTDSLQQAQINKLEALMSKARIRSDHHVLEIGFGWGSLSIMVARKTGCRVTGVTLSKEQKKYAEELVRRENLQDQITFKLLDYRLLDGDHGYDRILSCEMLEAVGHEFLPDFFRHCDRLMKKDGLLVCQVITTPDDRYDDYRTSVDFINYYIFPGGLCPSLTALIDAMKAASSFNLEHLENIGPNYATTLGEWQRRFAANKDKVLALGFDEQFVRMWNYYLYYCGSGFETRTLGTLQLVFTRPNNTSTLGQTRTFQGVLADN